MTLKFTTGAPCFIERGHLEPAPVSAETLDNVKISKPNQALEIQGELTPGEDIDFKFNAFERRYGASASS